MARSAISSSGDVGQMPGRRSAHWEFEESLLAILRRSRQEKGVVGIGVPKHLCDASRRFLRRDSAASVVRASIFLAARAGSRKARRFSQEVPGTPTCSSCRPDWRWVQWFLQTAPLGGHSWLHPLARPRSLPFPKKSQLRRTRYPVPTPQLNQACAHRKTAPSRSLFRRLMTSAIFATCTAHTRASKGSSSQSA